MAAGKQRFGKLLGDLGFKSKRIGRASERYWVGLRLKTAVDTGNDDDADNTDDPTNGDAA
jgi:hypothetical protein